MKFIRKNDTRNSKVYEVWEVMEKFGLYQKIQYFYVCFAVLFVSMTNINYIFVASDVNYRCRVPECEESHSTLSTDWWPNTTIGRCLKPVLRDDFTGDNCSLHSFTNSVETCTEWIYENNNSVISELNLACDPLKVNMIGTIHNVGMLISMIISGWVCDRFGRKPALIFFGLGSCIGHLKTFAPSYYVYAALEMLESSISGGTYPAGMVLMIEISGTKNRILSGILFAYAIYLGECLFASVAMVVPYWKTLIRIIYSPIILSLSFIFVVRESPRWQFLNNQTQKAIETIELAAKTNGLKMNKQSNEIMADKLHEKLSIAKIEDRESLLKVFTSKEVLKRLFVAAFTRFTANFVYYGLMINSVLLPGNKYTNFLLSTVMSFPGELISMYLMNRIGRKLPLIVGFIVCGALCVGSGYVPDANTTLKIALFLLGKMVIAVCYTGAVTYSMELFPTNARGTLLGICSLASRTGGMLAPLTPMLNEISLVLPAICFGGSALLSGAFTILTPETKDLPLMDTVEQVEASIRKKVASTKKESVNEMSVKCDDI